MSNKIKIALLDSGIDRNHERLYNKTIISVALEENEEGIIVNNSLNDENGHGTALAGIIYNHISDVELLGISVLNKELKSTIKTLVKAIQIAIENKVDIINLSLGTTQKGNIEELEQVCNLAFKQGILLVSAHHNKGIISYPAVFPNVFGVRSEFTIKKSGYRFEEDTLAVFANGCYQKVLWKDNSYCYKRGNSYACAHFTGVLAELLIRYPEAHNNMEKLKHILKSNEEERTLFFNNNKESIEKEKIVYFPVTEKFLKEYEEDIEYVEEKIVGIYDFRKFQYDFWTFVKKDKIHYLKLYNNIENALSTADSFYISNIDFIPYSERIKLIKEILIKVINLKKNVYLETQEMFDELEEFLYLAKEKGVIFSIYRL